MADFRSHVRGSSATRAILLALGAACLVMLPVQAAGAQLPEVDPCLTDPANCLPEPELEAPPLPQVDPCLADPASCLPDTDVAPLPEVDECTKDAVKCLSPDPSVEDCAKDVTGCAKETIDRCSKDVSRCLDREDPDGEEDEGSLAVPGNEPPRHSPGATGRTVSPSEAAATTGSDTTASPTEGGTEIGTALTSTASGSLLERIERGLADAARRFAFPLGVAAVVAAFLLVQGRIDRKDPKLAAAPIASQDDLVSFR